MSRVEVKVVRQDGEIHFYEYGSLDLAIVGLGKQARAPAATLQAGPKGTAAAPLTVEPVAPPLKTPRQPRSDAGKPRGPHAKNAAGASASGATAPNTGGNAGTEGTDPSKAGEKPANSTSTPQEAPAGAATSGTPPATNAPAAPAAPVAAVPTLDDVQKAVEILFAAKEYDITLLVLSRYGVKRGQDILPEQRAEFIAKAKAVAAGTEQP